MAAFEDATPSFLVAAQLCDDIFAREAGVFVQKLRLDVLQWICLSAPVSVVPAFRRVCRRWNQVVIQLVDGNANLRDDLDKHYKELLSGANDKRVWVGIRARPQESEGCLEICRNRVTMTIANAHRRDQEDNCKSYFFNAAFDEFATQANVWSQLAPRIMRCMYRREHACLLSYGQTGSGKTYTVFGNPEIKSEQGVAFRAVEQISKYLVRERDNKSNAQVPRVEFSFLEVYNEKVYDLLADQALCPLSYQRTILKPGNKYAAPTYSKEERVVPQGLTRRLCDLEVMREQVAAWLIEGAASRMMGRTVFNPRSSRSHAVATIHIRWHARRGCDTPDEANSEATPRTTCEEPETRLYLVDLAGSERAGQYALSAEQLREGVNINQSLSTLGRVVGALASGKGDHLPYRESVLTWLLSDAITGVSARAFMIATVQPAHPQETTSTLQYAQQYSNLQSDLSARIPKALAQVRRAQTRLRVLSREFDLVQFHLNQGKLTGIWDRDTIKERLVRAGRDARELTQRHRRLVWTDAHDTKMLIRDIGIVREVLDVPPGRERNEIPDGRKRQVLDPLATDNQPEGEQNTPDPVAKVVYPGKHGRPGMALWYPESALEEVRPPLLLRELAARVDQAEQDLRRSRELLKDLETQFAQQQQQWMQQN